MPVGDPTTDILQTASVKAFIKLAFAAPRLRVIPAPLFFDIKTSNRPAELGQTSVFKPY